MSALQNLALDLDGRLSVPGDPDWDDVRRAWNLAADQRPTAVVTAASVRDVQTTVRAAARLGLRVAPQGTGHNATPLDPLVSTILLRTGDLRSVVVDPLARIARVEAGALWQDVTAEAAKHGLMALAGSSGDVGVAGYTLGGGVSWFARSHGFSAQSVEAFDVVTADGRALRADAERHSDLFWALRGGGGGFAVVTAFEIRLYPIREVQAGVLFFPIHRAREVLHAWRVWTLTAPAEITSIGRLLRFPPDPSLPPFLTGRSFVVVEAVSTLDAASTDALLASLRALGPDHDTIATTLVEDLGTLHMDPPPVPGVGDGFLLDALPAQAVDAFLEVTMPEEASVLMSAEIRHVTGLAAAGRSGGPSAVDTMTGDYLGFVVGIAPDPASAAAVGAAAERVVAAMRPWAAPRMYQNFSERRRPASWYFDDGTLAALRRVKAQYDPENVIQANHEVE